jgi:hypothetical protein
MARKTRGYIERANLSVSSFHDIVLYCEVMGHITLSILAVSHTHAISRFINPWKEDTLIIRPLKLGPNGEVQL